MASRLLADIDINTSYQNIYLISYGSHLLGLWKAGLVFVAQSAAQGKQELQFDLQEQAKG